MCQLNGRSDWWSCWRISWGVGGGGTLCALCFSMHSIQKNAECTLYCGVGSTLKRYVQCRFSAERVRQEATEWSKSGWIRQLNVCAVCGDLKKCFGGGKFVLYIVPLQDKLDLTPLPASAPEFALMPKASCKDCNTMMPLQMLALHVDQCSPQPLKE